MHWQIVIRTRVAKQIQRLPRVVQQRYLVLQHELAIQGPVRGNWPNYSKLGDMRHHCHVKKGRPTYVAVWEEADVQERIIEVIYVGTYAHAPYEARRQSCDLAHRGTRSAAQGGLYSVSLVGIYHCPGG